MANQMKACHPCRPGPAFSFQDERYGKGQRVHTESIKDHKLRALRCTVCGKESPT